MKQFDPAQTSMIVGGKIISGFSDGTYINTERNEQAYNMKVGVDGEGTRVKNNNRSGKITIELMQSSPSNDDLTAFALADEANNAGAVPCLLKDGSGRTIVSAKLAWVQKQPATPLAKEATTRTWVLETDQLIMFVGGN